MSRCSSWTASCLGQECGPQECANYCGHDPGGCDACSGTTSCPHRDDADDGYGPEDFKDHAEEARSQFTDMYCSPDSPSHWEDEKPGCEMVSQSIDHVQASECVCSC